MKRLILTVACIVLYGCGGANAQTSSTLSNPQSRSGTMEQVGQGQALFEKYNSQYRNNPKDGRELLDRVAAYGLPKNSDSVKSVSGLLASRITKEEKVALIRILAQQHTYDNKTGLNDTIARDLQGHVNSGDREVATAATLALSRLVNVPDKREVLLSAKNRGLIDTDGYYGELAHAVAFSEADEQLKILGEIRNAKNRYAAEIITMTVNSPDIAKNLRPDARAEVASLLAESEPTFSQAVGQYDVIEGLRYAAWIRALATMRGAGLNKNSSELIMSKLSEERADPRKIIAVLTSGYAPQFVSEVGQRNRFDILLQRAALYAKQHPGNRDVKEAVEHIRMMINTSSK
ncbi:hypothetical protein ACFQUU_27570 [Herbaspirillum sp. GCM10030257]|uniref:hypothetical protein n=1 Tax=Herbaspirillum sp. GCM10030257 TaxID=3273393 RepID=UPI00361D0A29